MADAALGATGKIEVVQRRVRVARAHMSLRYSSCSKGLPSGPTWISEGLPLVVTFAS
jgi:hypothetical protein